MHIVLYFAGIILLASRIMFFGPCPVDILDAMLLFYGLLSMFTLTDQLGIARKLYRSYMHDFTEEHERYLRLERAIVEYQRLTGVK